MAEGEDDWNGVFSWQLWEGMSDEQIADCICHIEGLPTFREIVRWADDGGAQP